MKSNVRALFSRFYQRDFAQLRDDWSGWVNGRRLVKVFTPNPEQIVLAQENELYAHDLSQADVLLPDGIGVIVAEVILNRPEKRLHRLPGVDVVAWWLREGAQGSTKTLLLGGHENTAKKVADRFDLTGEWCVAVSGYQDVSQPQPAEEKALEHLILTTKPKVVFVAFGAPYQERWVHEHRELLEKAGVCVVMVCGGAFDFLAGSVPRAPKWIQGMGMEWAFRLYQQPWRWRRQLKLIVFLQLVVQELFVNGYKKA